MNLKNSVVNRSNDKGFAFISDSKLVEKRTIELPEQLKNVIECKNPRCITSVEQEIDHIFKLTDKEGKILSKEDYKIK